MSSDFYSTDFVVKSRKSQQFRCNLTRFMNDLPKSIYKKFSCKQFFLMIQILSQHIFTYLFNTTYTFDLPIWGVYSNNFTSIFFQFHLLGTLPNLMRSISMQSFDSWRVFRISELIIRLYKLLYLPVQRLSSVCISLGLVDVCLRYICKFYY